MKFHALPLGQPARNRLDRPRFVVAILLKLVLLVPAVASAASIRGVVRDPDGRPVGSARVTIVGPLGARTVQTDDGGRFGVGQLPAGTYRVVADAEGLHGSSEPAAVGADDERVVDVTLALNAVTESIVVSAAQVETPLDQVTGSATVVTSGELRGHQVESFTDALRGMPGLTVSRSGGRGALTSMFPRGGESDYTLVMVDGIRLNAFGGGLDLSLLDIGNVERIEFVRGPQSALYGADAIGGVVQVVTRNGGRPAGEALVEGGSQATSRAVALASGTTGAFTWGGSFERGASDGYRGVAPASGEHVTNDDDWHRQIAGTLGWHGRQGTVIRGVARAFDHDRGFPGPYGSNPIGAFPGVDRVSRGRNHDRQAGVSAATPLGNVFGGRMLLRLSSGYGNLRSEYESPFGPSEFETRRLAIRGQVDLALTPSSSVSAGIEGHLERARSTYITGATFQELPIERSAIGYFGELRQQVGDRLAFTAGLRLEHLRRDALEADPNPFAPRPAFPADAQVSANPRVGLVYTLQRTASGSTETRVHASAGTGIRPPDAFEIAYTDNPQLKPERSRSIEAGVSHVARRLSTDIQITAFRNDYDDLIVAVSRAFQDASQFRTDNISNARAQGVEVSAVWHGRWGLTGRAGYTWLDTEILAVDDAAAAPPPFEVGDPLVRRPAHQGSLGLTYAQGRWAGFADLGARGHALDIEPNFGAFGGLFTLPGFTVVNAGGSVRVHRAIDVFARGINLFDREYEEALGYPALGRSGMVGVRIAIGR